MSVRPVLVARSFVGALVVSVSAASLGAQVSAPRRPDSLYLPRAIRQAYAKGTRSRDGRPGAKYWQNRGRYTMTVTASPPDRTVRGTEASCT